MATGLPERCEVRQHRGECIEDDSYVGYACCPLGEPDDDQT